ncbi:MAG: cyclopropane-fatty-acyl-phospholipid synthase family protein [Thermodesulfobacteriota bacterium]
MSKDRSFDAEAIHHHYDLSNDFYALFLDPLMVYTCAYYRTPDGDLEQAQRDKLDLVCRKLRLQPGERYLDIGCGWGSLVVWAAKHYGVQALGVTLSAEQVKYAQEWIAREGLTGVCRVEHRDYRDLITEQPYDKISAIGIIEHVGIANYRSYFDEVYGLLEPGGLFLNHGITRSRYWKKTPQWDFLIEHVFPNGELDQVSHIASVMEDARFEVVDVESLRSHYARTCMHWAERLRANEDAAIRLVGERRYRTWLLYLTSSSIGFEQASIGLHQILGAKLEPGMRAVPTTREAIYAELQVPLARASGMR